MGIDVLRWQPLADAGSLLKVAGRQQIVCHGPATPITLQCWFVERPEENMHAENRYDVHTGDIQLR